jgi:hypothetical protein
MRRPQLGMLPCLAALAFVGAGWVAQANDTHDFTRYQIILDRSPFGSVTGGGADIPQPNFSARYGFVGTAQLSEASPLLAIIQDKETSRTYFKAEGETIGNTTVVRIGKSPGGKLVLKQGLEVATLTLETKAGVGAAPAGIGQPQPGQPPGMMSPSGVRRIPFRRGG